MCVIIAKPASVKAPSVENIIAAINTNPDGSAIVWEHDGVLETFKTLDADEMVKYYKEHFAYLNAHAFVFHARIATDGSIRVENCHGWKTLNGHAAFFHNGILQIKHRGDLTDSETFLRDIYEPIANNLGHKKAVKAINAIIGSSKFAFLGDNGHIKLYGHYEDINGVKYSNLNHLYRLNNTRYAYPKKPYYKRHYSYIDELEGSLTNDAPGQLWPWEK